jgi:hypothetical protein
MRSMQCNMEFGYQLSICSGTKENHRKPWSSWPVTGPSRCKLTSSQQSDIKYASPNTSPYMCFFFFFENIYKLFLQKLYLHIIWISTKPCITPVIPWFTAPWSVFSWWKRFVTWIQYGHMHLFQHKSACPPTQIKNISRTKQHLDYRLTHENKKNPKRI